MECTAIPVCEGKYAFDTFHYFPKLCPEVRLMIWELTMPPRLIHWRTSGGKALRIFSANRESRAATFLKHYKFIEIDFLRSQNYGFYFNPAIDTLYRRSVLPNLKPFQPGTDGEGEAPEPGPANRRG